MGQTTKRKFVGKENFYLKRRERQELSTNHINIELKQIYLSKNKGIFIKK